MRELCSNPPEDAVQHCSRKTNQVAQLARPCLQTGNHLVFKDAIPMFFRLAVTNDLMWGFYDKNNTLELKSQERVFKKMYSEK